MNSAKRTEVSSGPLVRPMPSQVVPFPVRLHLRNDLHLARKGWHIGMGLVISFLYMGGVTRSMGVMLLGSVLGVNLLVESARLRSPQLNEKIMRYWGPLMRSCEVNRISGTPYYIGAAILAMVIFPKPIAVLSILYLACGDPLASLVGILYGDRSYRFPNGKSLIGSAAAVAVCTLVTFLFLKASAVPDSAVFALTFVGGLVGGMAEHLPLEIDDNFTIPMVSGFVLWLSFIVLGV